LLIVIMILGTIGAFLIKQVQTESENLFTKQLVGLVGGILLVLIVSLIDYHFIISVITYRPIQYFTFFDLGLIKLYMSVDKDCIITLRESADRADFWSTNPTQDISTVNTYP